MALLQQAAERAAAILGTAAMQCTKGSAAREFVGE